MDKLTTKQAAEELGLSTARVLILIAQKRLKAEKYGRDWIIERTDLEEFKKIPRSPGNPNYRQSDSQPTS